MFINRLILRKGSQKSNKFWQIFENEYALHQTVWDLFGDRPDRKRDFLYRLDTNEKWPVVYTVSDRDPVDSNGIWDIETKDYDPMLKADTHLGFTVLVNPTRKREGKRHDVVMDLKYKNRNSGNENEKSMIECITETCTDWLKERSEKNGFTILSLRADGYRQNKFFKRKGGFSIQYSTVDLSGTLKVIDEEIFKKALFEGLGSEKAFGCGLMLVRKV